MTFIVPFLLLEKKKNIYKINRHWIGNYSIQCCPYILIDVKANSILYLARNSSNIVLQELSCFSILTVSGKQYQKNNEHDIEHEHDTLNIEHDTITIRTVVRKDRLILKRIPVFYGRIFSKNSLCPGNISFISLIMIMIISLNQHGIGRILCNVV